MKGFCVNFKDFSHDRLTTKGPIAANVPGGIAPAKAIPINYRYPIAGEKDVEACLVIRCPEVKTYKGIVPPAVIGSNGGGGGGGKSAIQVSFDVDTNPDHLLFTGTLGNMYDYTYDRKNSSYLPPANSTPSTGVLGTIYDWCVLQYAKYHANQETDGVGEEEPGPIDFSSAVKVISKDFFFHRRKYTEGENKGKLIEGAKPIKFFKLMSYKPGTPDENFAKFYLPNKEMVKDENLLKNRSFVFIPFLSFRRIFIGEKISVTMEVIESVIVDIMESVQKISQRSGMLIDQMFSDNPEAAAKVAEQFALLKEKQNTNLAPTEGRIKIDDDPSPRHEESNEIQTENVPSETDQPEPKKSLRERLTRKPTRPV